MNIYTPSNSQFRENFFLWNSDQEKCNVAYIINLIDVFSKYKKTFEHYQKPDSISWYLLKHHKDLLFLMGEEQLLK